MSPGGYFSVVRKLTYLAALKAVCVASLASAQFETRLGSRIAVPAPADVSPVLQPADRSRAALIAFGQCIILNNRASAERALALYLNGPVGKKALNRLATSECIRNGELSVDYMLMREALFIGLYRADFSKTSPILSDIPVDYGRDVGTSADVSAGDYIAVRQLAECVVRASPAASRDLVLAPVASKRETAAFTAIIPHISTCVTACNHVSLSKIVLVGLVAEALYRLSISNLSASAGNS